MDYLIPTKLKLATALLAAFALICNLPAPAQDQDTGKKMDDLRKEISFLSSRVCGDGAVKDSATDSRRQTLTADATALKALLEQQKAKLTGADLDTTRNKQRIEEEEKALAQPCPALPVELDKLVNAAAPAAAAALPALPHVTVAPSGGLDYDPQTIGTRSDAKSVTVTNNSGDDLDMFVWYGTHLPNFKVSDNTCDAITPDQGTCTFKVTFAPTDMHPPDETLRIVRRTDWKKYEKVRLALKRQGQISQEVSNAQAAFNQASQQVSEQQKELKETSAPLQFCEHPPAIAGKNSAKVVEACENLKKADDRLRKAQEVQRAAAASEDDVKNAANELKGNALAVIPLSGTPNHWKYPLTRAVVGLDMSAVSSQTVKQAYFVDFDLLAPFKLPGMKGNEDALENRLWFWLNPRITSLPKGADFSALSTIDESGTFFTNFSSKGTVGDIAQGFDVNGGLEFALLKPRDGIPWWGEYVNTQARLGASFIVGGGISTPFSVDNTDVPAQVNQSICDAFKAPAGATVSGPAGLVCTFPSGSTNPVLTVPNPAPGPGAPATVQDQFIDFFTQQRSRFFRRYYAGFRLKTYFFSPDVKGECNPKRKDKNCDAPYDIFPGIIDVTVGQDEAVTAGHLKNILFRVEGVYPLPFVPGLHIFGSIYSSINKDHPDFPLNSFSVSAPANGASNDLNTFRFALPPLNRDYFRIGVGIDLIQLLKRNKGGQPTADTAAAPGQGDSGGTPPAPGK